MKRRAVALVACGHGAKESTIAGTRTAMVMGNAASVWQGGVGRWNDIKRHGQS